MQIQARMGRRHNYGDLATCRGAGVLLPPGENPLTGDILRHPQLSPSPCAITVFVGPAEMQGT